MMQSLKFGPVKGKKDEVILVEATPEMDFLGQKIIATDSWVTPGLGTRIKQVYVDGKYQRPLGAGATLTAFFANNSLGNGIKHDLCPAGKKIGFEIMFINDCEWRGLLTEDETIVFKALSEFEAVFDPSTPGSVDERVKDRCRYRCDRCGYFLVASSADPLPQVLSDEAAQHAFWRDASGNNAGSRPDHQTSCGGVLRREELSEASQS